MSRSIEDLTTPSTFALSQACQAAVGIIEQTPHHGWPDFQALTMPFAAVPLPVTYADALQGSVVLYRFLERAGHEIHVRVHGGHIPRSCPFNSSGGLQLNMIDQLHPELWTAMAAVSEWVSTYERDFASRHQRTIAERALERLRRRCGGTNASDVAREVGCSVPALHRHFARATGRSLRQYVIELRIDRAIHLLRETDWKIEAIASAVGWESKNNLHTAFARRLGATPESVRRLDDTAADDLRRRLLSPRLSQLTSCAEHERASHGTDTVAPLAQPPSNLTGRRESSN